MKVELLSYTPEPEKVVASAGKLCYSKVGASELKNMTDEEVDKFINVLISLGHESPLEHVSFTFAIEGISRTTSHQLVRHRIASYSQQSQRYVNLDSTFEYITPPSIIENNLDIYYDNIMNIIHDSYKKISIALLRNKIIKYCENNSKNDQCKEVIMMSAVNMEDSTNKFKEYLPKLYSKFEKESIEDVRFILPNACETKIVVTMNARSLLNFFSHRCCDRAQWEIRNMANLMLDRVKEVAPTLFKSAGAPCLRGKCPEGSLTCGNPKGVVNIG